MLEMQKRHEHTLYSYLYSSLLYTCVHSRHFDVQCDSTHVMLADFQILEFISNL